MTTGLSVFLRVTDTEAVPNDALHHVSVTPTADEYSIKNKLDVVNGTTQTISVSTKYSSINYLIIHNASASSVTGYVTVVHTDDNNSVAQSITVSPGQVAVIPNVDPGSTLSFAASANTHKVFYSIVGT